VRTRQSVTQSSQRTIHRMAAVQESEHRHSPHADFFERSPDAKISSRRYQPFFQSGNRLGRASGLVINFRQIQIQLGMVVLHPQRLAAQRFRVAESFFGQRGQQAGVGKIASSDCPSRRFFRHSLKSFIPASEGDVVPIQWDMGSFLNPAGTSRVTEGRVPAHSARANRTDVQLLGYSLLLAQMTGKDFRKARSFVRPGGVVPMSTKSPYFIGFIAHIKTVRGR
jgi:hypothetical protein